MSSFEVFPSIKTPFRRNPVLYNSNCSIYSNGKSIFFGAEIVENFTKKNVLALSYNGEAGSIVQQGLHNLPLSVELEPISGEAQFDRVIAEAQQLDESIVILWMATWCRKCIYLKPKLEKLAADYYPRLDGRPIRLVSDNAQKLLVGNMADCYLMRFCCVDVNNVPHKLVVHAGVTKMPTIQLWRDGKKQAEVIGGHKAYLLWRDGRKQAEVIGGHKAVNEVREMIENENSST